MDERTRKILMERGLASHMNDTKWRELCVAVGTLPFAPAYQVKRLGEAEPYPADIAQVPTYLGDWGKTYEARLDVDVEWIKVSPRYGSRSGAVIDDCSNAFRQMLKNLRIPFVEHDNQFTIYGHSGAIDFDTV